MVGKEEKLPQGVTEDDIRAIVKNTITPDDLIFQTKKLSKTSKLSREESERLIRSRSDLFQNETTAEQIIADNVKSTAPNSLLNRWLDDHD